MSARPSRRAPFELGGVVVPPGRTAKVDLPISNLISGTPVNLTVLVRHGRMDGPTVFLTAAVHGDEIAGVEIIRRVLDTVDARTLAGTILAVPVVNVHGFIAGSRYLPDRRDLNRSFPGSPRGSLAARVAHLMMNQVVQRCSLGIDLHTGSDHRINLPHVRADLADERASALAATFGAPVTLHARIRDGSLRAAGTEAGATVLVFEGGEADRFDEPAIATGVAGVLRALAAEGMTGESSTPPPSRVAGRSRWSRATRSGVLRVEVDLGAEVSRGTRVASLYDPFGKRLSTIAARGGGLVIGHTQRPLVNRGDAVVHIAEPVDLGG